MKEEVREVMREIVTFFVCMLIIAFFMGIFTIFMVIFADRVPAENRKDSLGNLARFLAIILAFSIKYIPKMYLKIRTSISRKFNVTDNAISSQFSPTYGMPIYTITPDKQQPVEPSSSQRVLRIWIELIAFIIAFILGVFSLEVTVILLGLIATHIPESIRFSPLGNLLNLILVLFLSLATLWLHEKLRIFLKR